LRGSCVQRRRRAADDASRSGCRTSVCRR
jgi:hypothetical protein